jgi:hypothetical protein
LQENHLLLQGLTAYIVKENRWVQWNYICWISWITYRI